MFLRRNNKINVYPCNPQFYYIKLGFRVSTLYRHAFVMRIYVSNNTSSAWYCFVYIAATWVNVPSCIRAQRTKNQLACTRSVFKVGIWSLVASWRNQCYFRRTVKTLIWWFSTQICCLFVLRFYGPVNPMGSCRARSVYLTTRLPGRLSPLSG